MKVNNEKELQKHLIENFDKYFNFKFIASEFVLPNKKRIDLLGEDDYNVYIIELKCCADSKAIYQLLDYMNLYKKIAIDDKNIVGIVAAPIIKEQAYETIQDISSNIELMVLDDLIKTGHREKYTTTLSTEVIIMLKALASEAGVSCNIIIEQLVKEVWEARKNEVEKRGGDLGRESSGTR